MDDYWVIQGNANDIYMVEMEYAINELGLGWDSYNLAMFSTELPERPDFESVVFYGATTTTAAAAVDPIWKDSVWYDQQDFRWSNLASIWGDLMLNQHWYRTTFESVPYTNKPVFVRPDYDLKEFEGHVTTTHELAAWSERLAKIADDAPTLRPFTPIIIAPVLNIAREWRCFVVDGRVVSMSRYRSFGELDVQREFNHHAVDLINKALNIYTPADVFVIDIGAMSDNTYGIIEVNCFNSAGWYDADIKAVVNAINHRKNK